MSSRHSVSAESRQVQVELDLLDAILLGDDANYPWNPIDREANAQLNRFEENLDFEDIELGDRCSVFFQRLDTCWLETELRQKFGARVPHDILDTIVRQAGELVASNLSAADRLVRCVQGLLPNWSIDDLQVLARPFAYAMRGDRSDVASTSEGNWAELSSIERARLSLAIAHFTLLNLNSDV
ncbi:hypothetical protein [Baaleninema sp.]|uniref:hypothetical protein n=1 Tax=Baaleninema sp. TaxID=3101197 RepID=UPI003D058C5C